MTGGGGGGKLDNAGLGNAALEVVVGEDSGEAVTVDVLSCDPMCVLQSSSVRKHTLHSPHCTGKSSISVQVFVTFVPVE